jgi:type IV pilus assembly protein PilP
MTRGAVLLLVCAGFAAGCDSKPKPAARSAPASQATAQPQGGAAAPSAEEAPQAEWVYSSAGKRDPFRSFLREAQTVGAGIATRCATPLGRFEIEQLKVVAVVTGLEDPVAMLEAPNGVGYAVRRGACIGKNGGSVAAVRSGEVVVAEWAIRADGTRERTQTVLRLPREAALNLEE